MAGRAGRAIYRDPRWKIVRKRVLARDQYRCTRCAKAGRLEVHHLHAVADNPKADQFDTRTLVTLCRDCHFGTHITEKLPADRLAWREYLNDAVA